MVCPGFVTDDGMYDRWAQHGIHAPKIAGTSKPEKVASVVVDCIRKDRSEVIVNTPPVRPLVVLANMFPSITPILLRRFGYTGTFEKVMAPPASSDRLIQPGTRPSSLPPSCTSVRGMNSTTTVSGSMPPDQMATCTTSHPDAVGPVLGDLAVGAPTSATDPTAPVASAAMRSISRGLTRPATWLFVAAVTGFAIPMPSR